MKEDTYNYWNSIDQHNVLDKFNKRKELITVVIPALNEENTILNVIESVKLFCDEIIVVDGHSNDKTFQLAQKDIKTKAILDNNIGKGDAIRVGINESINDIIVLIDADMSHNPEHIPSLVVPLLEKKADMVIGSRLTAGSDELDGTLDGFIRMIGSCIITAGINLRFNTKLTDSQNGFRAFRKSFIQNIPLKEKITTIEQEMIIKSLKARGRLHEVPAHEYNRKDGKSKIVLKKVFIRYIYSWLRYLIFP